MKYFFHITEQCKENKISFLLSELNSTLELYREKDIEDEIPISNDN